VVLKKLEDAMRDRDHIYAVIRSSYANNDGNAKVGYTAPAVKGQADCIAAAIKLAGVQSGSIGYIEAHGTATRLGDPVEVRALNEAFGTGGYEKCCAIGSVKSNIGHLDAAAGVAGLMKAAMSLYFKSIPPSLHFKEPNAEIDFDGGPFYVNTKVVDWQRINGAPLRAGVSSFGIGGTNVHMVLEEAPPLQSGEWHHEYKLLTASAKTASSLSMFLAELKHFVLEEPGPDLSAMAYTMQVGRQHHVFRYPLVFSNRDELIKALTAAEQEQPIKSREKPDHCVFLFPGQGVQYIHMGKRLYEQEPVFREWMDRGFDVLEKLTGENFKHILFPLQEDLNLVNNTKYTQPLIFLVEYSLASLLMHLGIKPQYMLGHSIGEYTAACISGVFDFHNALRLVVRRGALMNKVPTGAMISLGASAETAAAYLGNGISLAAVNAPEQVVLSGDNQSIEALCARLGKTGIQFTRLKTSHAFHSAMQDEILEEFRQEANAITYNAPAIPFISNLTGTFIKDEEAVSPAYWVRHLRETVKFHQGIQTLLSLNQKLTVIEAGPGAVLTGLFSLQPTAHNHNLAPMMPSARQQKDDHRFLMKQLGQLWSQGMIIDWNAWYNERAGKRISLPGYSFDKERYQAEVNLFQSGILNNLGDSSNENLSDWIYYPSWKRTIPLMSAIPDNERRSFLIFCDNTQLSASLRQALQNNGDDWVQVLPGQQFQMSGNESIAITDIIYCRGIERNENDSKAPMETFLDLARCVQSISKHNTFSRPRLTAVTANLHKVTGTDKLSLNQSLVQGIINGVQQELGWWCMSVDIDMYEQPGSWTGKLATEIRVNNSDRIVAWRQGQRWVKDFQKNDLPVTGSQPMIRQQGVYLITGGLGNAGFELAKYLLKNYNATLALTGRREPDQIMQRLNLLKNTGGEVRYYQADVSDLAALQLVVEETERNYGPIHGVIHAAGVLDRGLFEAASDITPAKAMAMFAPKIKGIENLYALLGHRSPDFVCVLSSLSAILGGQGFAAYAAANAYMDHFVDLHAGELTTWKCLDLPALVFTDEQAQADHTAIGPSDLSSLLEWSLSFSGSHVIIVNKDDLPARIKKTFTCIKPIDHNTHQVVTERSKRNRPDLTVEYRKRKQK
jgi:acyl transferase domain-containing protein